MELIKAYVYEYRRMENKDHIESLIKISAELELKNLGHMYEVIKNANILRDCYGGIDNFAVGIAHFSNNGKETYIGDTAFDRLFNYSDSNFFRSNYGVERYCYISKNPDAYKEIISKINEQKIERKRELIKEIEKIDADIKVVEATKVIEATKFEYYKGPQIPEQDYLEME